jgi:hypothetical protein
LIQDPLAVKILAGEFQEGDKVRIDADGDALLFEHGGSSATEENVAETERTLH